MRNKKYKNRQSHNPEIQISFKEQNHQRLIDQSKLNMEMLRVHATQKQRVIKDIWEMGQEELCKFFTSYKLFPHDIFKLKKLLDSPTLKLIKSKDKIYFGQVDKKKRTGIGIYVSREGKLYEGQFKENERHGRGIQIYENGNLYIGEFQNNKKHGTGKFFWFNVSSKSKTQIQFFDGQWWGGLPDGNGIHQKHNGDTFTGTFKNGLKHGLGQEYFGNGDYYKGQYVNGMPEGFGEYLWKDKSYYKGDFKQGLRSGYGFWCIKDEQSTQNYQGHYAMDKKSGYGVYEWENGWTYKGNFQNDFRNGYGELFNREGAMAYKGYWENGQQVDGEPINMMNTTNANDTHESCQIMSAVNPKRQRSASPKKKYQSIDFQGHLSRYKLNSQKKIVCRPGFSIKKRPQSHSHLVNTEAVMHHRYTPVKHKQQTSTNYGYTSISSSASRPTVKFNNIYVPWQHSSRLNR